MRAIITFHSIDDGGSVLSYAPKTFADFMKWLSVSSLPVCSLDTLLGSEQQQPGVVLSFDDGMKSVYTQALPVLKNFGFIAHLFLTTGVVGGSNRWPGQAPRMPKFDMLDWDQVEACHRAGMRVESHTNMHPDLRRVDAQTLEQECVTADEIIADRLGRRPRYFAYPYGYSTDQVRAFARIRYAASLTTELRFLSTSEDYTALPRIDSYYLQSPWTYRRLGTLTTRSHLTVRRLARRLKGRLARGTDYGHARPQV